MSKKQYKIDATGKKLGRLASEVAFVLLGKNSPDFAKNKVADVEIVVENAQALDISDKKRDQKQYDRYSGYPGGRKVFTMKEVIEKKGYAEIIKMAVLRMLPKNKLQKRRIKNLIVNE